MSSEQDDLPEWLWEARKLNRISPAFASEVAGVLASREREIDTLHARIAELEAENAALTARMEAAEKLIGESGTDHRYLGHGALLFRREENGWTVENEETGEVLCEGVDGDEYDAGDDGEVGQKVFADWYSAYQAGVNFNWGNFE